MTTFPTTLQPIPLYPSSKPRIQRRPGPLKPRYGVPRSEWPSILRRVEQGESLRIVAQDYHVSYQTCIGYLAHPFEKKGLWAVIASHFLAVRCDWAIDRGEELFSFTRENTGVWTANLQGRHTMAL